MKWLLTAEEKEGPNLVHYREWVHGADIATEVIRPSQPLPPTEEFDALLLTGGGDIDPARYGQTAHAETGGVHRERDEMEFCLFKRFHLARRSVLGICRGLQVVQVALGGRLLQHVPDLVNPMEERHSPLDGQDSVHTLNWRPGPPLAVALQGRATECNSSHHQAANPSALGHGLAVVAVSAHGIVEAMELVGDNDTFISCVQWHPERMQAAQPAGGALRDYWVEQVRRRADVRQYR